MPTVAVSEGSSDGTDRFVFDGKHNTGVQELTKWLVDPKRVPSVPRTGLTDFDEACGGFPDTGVVLLGATTSSGKSVMAKQIGLNMVRSYMGMRVSMVTLEMSREQEFTRTMSNLAEIDGQQLARNNLTDDGAHTLNRWLWNLQTSVARTTAPLMCGRQMRMTWVLMLACVTSRRRGRGSA